MGLERMASQSDAYDSVLVFSDVHIGLPEGEIFGKDFEAFVDFVVSTSTFHVDSEEGGFQFDLPRAIILSGDFLDLWDGKISNLPDFIANFARVLAEKTNVFYLRGNHDYIIPDIPPKLIPVMKRFEICEYKVLEIGGKACFFMHGHQFMSAFGPLSLKFESYIDPYYTLMESFLSRFCRGNGANILKTVAVLFVVLGALLALDSWPSSTAFALWMSFGLFLPSALVSIWRLLQKSLWKGISLVLGEVISRFRGAVRGDTVEYLTTPSKPISRCFEQGKEGSVEARRSGFVCFGHTHIPEGPMPGTDKRLSDMMFLNTGSWMRPSSRLLQTVAEKARIYTRAYDKLDEFLVIPSLVVLAYLGLTILPVPALVLALALLVVESVVALGKSSYRRIPGHGVRSLAFIGKDTNDVWRSTLLYWDPKTGELSSSPVMT
jgi:UDP-2,3-diacylglucosamine pyrophosphatase LpxH